MYSVRKDLDSRDSKTPGKTKQEQEAACTRSFWKQEEFRGCGEGGDWSSDVGLEFLRRHFGILHCGFPYSFSFFAMHLFQLVATLPDGVQPGPDFHGLPWKPVLLTAFLGIASFAVFFWRTILVVSKLS